MSIKVSFKRGRSNFGRSVARQSTTIDCPKCKRSIALTMGDLKPGNTATCSRCGAKVEFTGDDIVGTAEKVVEDFTRKLERIFR